MAWENFIRNVGLLIVLQMIIVSWSFGQITFLNGEFSLSDSCPESINEFGLLTDWEELTGAPDFYDCDFTFWIEHPLTDYDSGETMYAGFSSEGDSLLSADSFGQNLNEPILPGVQVEIRFIAQTVYGGMYKNDCAGIALYGMKDSLQDFTGYNNAGEHPLSVELGITEIYTDFWWQSDIITFTATDTINALIFSPELVPGCKQYFFIDQISIDNTVGISNQPENKATLFPNPSDETICVEYPNKLEETSFSIFSINGNLVMKGFLDNNCVEIGNLPSGIYFMHIAFSDQLVEIKFVKE